MAEWYSVADSDAQERLLLAWPDAPLANLEVCGLILGTAREQVLAYAPEPPADDVTVVDGIITSATVTPDRYVLAQLRQAENLWNAGRVNSSGDVGVDTFTFTPRPLDKTVRQIIRPVDGKPHVL
jgi:hypothetical protein